MTAGSVHSLVTLKLRRTMEIFGLNGWWVVGGIAGAVGLVMFVRGTLRAARRCRRCRSSSRAREVFKIGRGLVKVCRRCGHEPGKPTPTEVESRAEPPVEAADRAKPDLALAP